MSTTQHHRLAFAVEHRFQRQVARVEQGVMFGLPVVLVDGLLKIALAIKEADPDKPKVQIAGGFGVVARQNPQPARRDGQRFMETEFRGKIGDRIAGSVPARFAAPRFAGPACRSRNRAAPAARGGRNPRPASGPAVRNRRPRAGRRRRCGKDSASNGGTAR